MDESTKRRTLTTDGMSKTEKGEPIRAEASNVQMPSYVLANQRKKKKKQHLCANIVKIHNIIYTHLACN